MKEICLFSIVIIMLYATPGLPAANNEEIQTLSQGGNAFAIELYQQLAGEPGNLFFSPFSVSSALAMAYGGARGQTASQMEKVLRFPYTGEKLAGIFGELLKYLNEIQAKGKVALNIANSLWPQKGFDMLDGFTRQTRENFQMEIISLDYANDEANARREINNWVEDNTNNRIQNLLSSPLPPATRLILVNAVYFKGGWLRPFDEAATVEQDFYTGKEVVKAQMMRQTGPFNYAENQSLQMLELPYAGESLSMLVLLPRDKSTGALAELEKSLTSRKLNELKSMLALAPTVKASLPRFQLTWGSISLKNALMALGMRDAFGSQADFRGMTGNKNLHIDDVLQKAFVEVNEQGTEAAAATGVIVASRSFNSPVPEFRADHPFIFIIQEKSTGNILFMGRLVNPAMF